MQALRFFEFELQVAERRLLRAGAEVPLAPKVFDLLALLVARAGRLVRKEELLAALWPGVAVTESNLTQTVFVLRRALGEIAGRRFVETVPRAGYRFVAPVEGVEPAPPGAGAAVAPLEPGTVERAPRTRRRWALLGLAAALLLAAALWRSAGLRGDGDLAPPAPGEPADAVELAARREAHAALERGDSLAAARILERVPVRAGEAPLLTADRIVTAFGLGDQAGARRLAEAAVSTDGGDLAEADRLWIEAAHAQARGDTAGMLTALERLFTLDPTAVQIGVRWATALARAGRPAEGDLVIGRLRQLPAALAEDPRVDVAEALVAYERGDPQRMLAAVKVASTKLAATPGASPFLLGRAFQLEGSALLDLGHLAEADGAFERAGRLAEEAGAPGETARVFHSRGLVADRRGQLERSAELFAVALDGATRAGDLATAGGLRIELAGVEFRRGRFTEAVRLYSAALDDPSVRDSTRRRTVAEVNLGLCRIELGELARAREHFETALALDRERDDPGYDAWSLFGLAGVALEGGEVEEAARWLDETERQAARAGSKELLGLIEAARARVHLAAGDPAAARSSAASAARIAAEVGAGDPVAAAAEASAAIAAVEGRCADAEGHAARLAAELGSEAYPVERALAAAAAASCWDAAGRSEEAARAFELARRGAETTDSARVRRAVDEVAARLAR